MFEPQFLTTIKKDVQIILNQEDQLNLPTCMRDLKAANLFKYV